MIGFNDIGKFIINVGIGNQLFRYAAIKGIAKKHGYDFCISPDNLLKDVFVLKNIIYRNLSAEVYPETTWRYSDQYVKLCKDNVILYGLFQDERYFKEVEFDLRNDLVFLPEILNKCIAIRKEYPSKVVSLHVRRGDYINNPYFLSICHLSYYEKALEQFDFDTNVMVFSDELDWCREQSIFSGNKFTFMDLDYAHTLCLMSLCSDFIIANSTFSWWGAWLANKTKDSKVIAPLHWWDNDKMNQTMYKNMIPKQWTKLC